MYLSLTRSSWTSPPSREMALSLSFLSYPSDSLIISFSLVDVSLTHTLLSHTRCLWLSMRSRSDSGLSPSALSRYPSHSFSPPPSHTLSLIHSALVFTCCLSLAHSRSHSRSLSHLSCSLSLTLLPSVLDVLPLRHSFLPHLLSFLFCLTRSTVSLTLLRPSHVLSFSFIRRLTPLYLSLTHCLSLTRVVMSSL